MSQNHPHVSLTRPDGSIDRFDADIAPLVQLLFERGVIERHSCQGDPFMVDQTRYEGREHRAYIMLEHNDEARDFLSMLIASFPAFREEKVSWSIEIDQEPLRKFTLIERYNPKPRITIRFPHQDIQKLIDWLKDHRERMDLLHDLEKIYNSTGENFNEAAIEELLREDNNG